MKQGETRVIFANLTDDATQLMVAETPLHINERNLNEVERLANGNYIFNRMYSRVRLADI